VALDTPVTSEIIFVASSKATSGFSAHKLYNNYLRVCVFCFSQHLLPPQENYETSHTIYTLTQTYALQTYFLFVSWGGVRLSPFCTSATDWFLVVATDDNWIWTIWWNDNWQGKNKYSEKPAPVALSPSQIPQDMIWDLTRVTAVGSRPLTAWAMARPVTKTPYTKTNGRTMRYQHMLVEMIQTTVCRTVFTAVSANLHHSSKQPIILILQNMGREIRPKKTIFSLCLFNRTSPNGSTQRQIPYYLNSIFKKIKNCICLLFW
jgi:hypothetical protein